MCGIVTIVKNKYKNSDEILKKMLLEIKHRGPDHTGKKKENDEYAYGMTRLSIIDLKGGEQPIFTSGEDGDFSIVFNGEIYNYKDLREELIKDGYVFKTNSDTETILHLYRKYKETPKIFLNKLRGMFAFSIFDKKEDKIFVARDFFGIKPLYYFSQKNKVLAFGSEAKTLLLHPEYEKKINFSAVKNYLSYQYNPLKETFFKNIFKLSPGNFMEIKQSSGEFKIQSYFDFKFKTKKELQEFAGCKNINDIENKTFSLIEESVKYHLESDVPVGAFLSGGVDSFITTAMIRHINPKAEIHTFTIGGEEKNEFDGARMAANFLKTNHTEIKLTREKYFKNLQKMIWYFDEPVADPAGYALYFLAQEARKKVKVVLAGEGADEFFGGYGMYLEPIAVSPISNLPKPIKKFLSFAIKNIPFNFKGKNYIKRGLTPLKDKYIGNANIFKEEEIKKIWKEKTDFPLEFQENFDISKIYKKAEGLSEPTKMQYIDINTWLIGDILQKGDKMSMAQSLEVRTPFLDRVVSEFASKIPDNLKFKYSSDKKISGQNTKYLLRKVAQKLGKNQIEDRKRIGFVIPLADWLRKEKFWKDQLINSTFFETFLNKNEIKKLIFNFENKNNNIYKEREYSRKIFTLLVLDLWYKEFFG